VTKYYVKDSDYLYVRPPEYLIDPKYRNMPMDDNIVLLTSVQIFPEDEPNKPINIDISFFSKTKWSAMQTWIDVQQNDIKQYFELKEKLIRKSPI